MSQIFYYELTAYSDKGKVNQLQDELAAAITNKTNYSVLKILALLPLTISNPEDLSDRDVIAIGNQGAMANNGSGPVTVFFSDNALGNFSITIPKNLQATGTLPSATSLSIAMSTNDLVIKLDKIADQGYDRSAYQIVTTLLFDHSNFTTILMDSVKNDLLTYMHVKLDPTATSSVAHNFSLSREINDQLKKSQIKTFNFSGMGDLGNPCDGGDDTYIVVKRNGTNVCIVHNSSWIVGGNAEWTQVGPTFDNESDAQNYSNTAPECHD